LFSNDWFWTTGHDRTPPIIRKGRWERKLNNIVSRTAVGGRGARVWQQVRRNSAGPVIHKVMANACRRHYPASSSVVNSKIEQSLAYIQLQPQLQLFTTPRIAPAASHLLPPFPRLAVCRDLLPACRGLISTPQPTSFCSRKGNYGSTWWPT